MAKFKGRWIADWRIRAEMHRSRIAIPATDTRTTIYARALMNNLKDEGKE